MQVGRSMRNVIMRGNVRKTNFDLLGGGKKVNSNFDQAEMCNRVLGINLRNHVIVLGTICLLIFDKKACQTFFTSCLFVCNKTITIKNFNFNFERKRDRKTESNILKGKSINYERKSEDI